MRAQRIVPAVLAAAAALLLSACAPAAEEVVSSPPASAALPPSTALEFADQFEFYNTSADPHDFTIGYIQEISLQDGRLVLSSDFSAGLAADPSLSSLGTLSAPFVYDGTGGCFSLEADFTLSLHEPAAFDADTLS